MGGALLTGGAFFAVACGSDSSGGTGVTTNPPDAKGDNNAPGPDGGGGDGGDDGGNLDCTKAPKLRTNTTDFYCAFVDKDGGTAVNPEADGGDVAYCHNDQVCCDPSTKTGANFDPSYCAHKAGTGLAACTAGAGPLGFTWTAGSTWECADKNNCTSGEVCCLTSADAGAPVNIGKSTDKNIPAGCNALQAFKQGGTRCAASCAAGTEIKLCSNSDQNCGAGTTCTPFAGFFRDLGYCR
jgi:hypothetical protein